MRKHALILIITIFFAIVLCGAVSAASTTNYSSVKVCDNKTFTAAGSSSVSSTSYSIAAEGTSNLIDFKVNYIEGFTDCFYDKKNWIYSGGKSTGKIDHFETNINGSALIKDKNGDMVPYQFFDINYTFKYNAKERNYITKDQYFNEHYTAEKINRVFIEWGTDLSIYNSSGEKCGVIGLLRCGSSHGGSTFDKAVSWEYIYYDPSVKFGDTHTGYICKECKLDPPNDKLYQKFWFSGIDFSKWKGPGTYYLHIDYKVTPIAKVTEISEPTNKFYINFTEDSIKKTLIIPIKITTKNNGVSFDKDLYSDVNSAAWVTVSDSSANKSKSVKETVNVKVRSFRAENGNAKNPALDEISLKLTETGVNTGVFRGGFVFDAQKPTRKNGIYVLGTPSKDYVEGKQWISKSPVKMPKNILTWMSAEYFMPDGIFQALYTQGKTTVTKEAKYSFYSNVQGKVEKEITEYIKYLDKTTTVADPIISADVWLIPKGKKTAYAHTKTDKNGYYRFTNIKPGNYSVYVYAKGTSKSSKPFTYETETKLITGENRTNFPAQNVAKLSKDAFNALKKSIGEFEKAEIKYTAIISKISTGYTIFSVITAKTGLGIVTAFLGELITTSAEQIIVWKYESEAKKFLNNLYNQMTINPKKL